MSLRCSRCLGAMYCNQQCQAAHWQAGHRNACKNDRALELFAYPLVLALPDGITYAEAFKRSSQHNVIAVQRNFHIAVLWQAAQRFRDPACTVKPYEMRISSVNKFGEANRLFVIDHTKRDAVIDINHPRFEGLALDLYLGAVNDCVVLQQACHVVLGSAILVQSQGLAAGATSQLRPRAGRAQQQRLH